MTDRTIQRVALLVTMLCSTVAWGAGANKHIDSRSTSLRGNIAANVLLVSGTPGWPQSMGFIATAEGFWKDAGLTGLQFRPLASGTAAGNAIADRAAPIGYTNTITALALLAHGAPIKILTGTTIGGDGVVVWGNKIHSVRQLKGKSVGVPAGRTTHEMMFLLHVLPQAGLSRKDVHLVPLSPPNMLLPLERGRLAAAVLFDPYMNTIVAKGGTVLVPPDKMWGGPSYTSVLIARDSLIRDNPALVQAVVDVHTRTIEFIKHHPRRAAADLAKASQQEVSVVLAGLKDVTPVSGVNAKAFQGFADALGKEGVIEHVPNVSNGVDASFVERSNLKYGTHKSDGGK